jgi:hypothetical protein
VQFAAQHFGDGVARAVIVSGSQAAAGDDQVGTQERDGETGAHVFERIADHVFVDDANAEPVQLIGEK